jgi:hypothetical protein
MRDMFGLLPPPLAGEGWGGGERADLNLVACPLPVPPAEVGCFRLRPVNKTAELGYTRVRPQAGEGTMWRQHETLQRREPNEFARAANFLLTRVTRIFQKSLLTKIAPVDEGGKPLSCSLSSASARCRVSLRNATTAGKKRPSDQPACFRPVLYRDRHNSRVCRRPSWLGAQQ